MDRLAQYLEENPSAELGPLAQCVKCDKFHQTVLTPTMIHKAKYFCDGKTYFLAKDENEKKPKRKSNLHLLYLIPETMRGFCAICLRTKEHLQALRPVVTMDVHHIIPVENGGKDITDNLQILCYQCHSDVHRMRERFDRYIKP